MPSNKKARSKKKKTDAKRQTTATGYWPTSQQCSNCGQDGTKETPIRACARCGMTGYCGVQCQTSAYKEHKEFCKQTAADHDPDDEAALSSMLHSRCFGGAVSLLMHQTQHVRLMKGFLHVKCSHPFSEYCKRRRTEDKRSISIGFVSEGEKLLELQERLFGPVQPGNDGDSEGPLEGVMAFRQTMADKMENRGENMNERVTVIVVEQPGVQQVKIYVFFSYMGQSHEAHTNYSCLVRDKVIRWPDISTQVVLDWDWDWDSIKHNPEATDLDYPLQWLFYNSIGPAFYQQCSLAWQEKRRTDGKSSRSPLPIGVFTPPMAFLVDFSHLV